MIELQNVWRTYRMKAGVVDALVNISLRVGKGDFISVSGPSGSGKSTLLNIIGCLDQPDQGAFRIGGEDVDRLDDDRLSAIRNRRIGFVFQSFHLLPRLTVLENILLPLRFYRSGGKIEAERALSLLDRVGLSDRRSHYPNQLSGGQAQRVAIARALMLNPVLLLADEPTGNLDSKTASQVLTLLEEVNAAGQAIVLVTHDQEIAARAPRRIRLNDGRIEDDAVF